MVKGVLLFVFSFFASKTKDLLLQEGSKIGSQCFLLSLNFILHLQSFCLGTVISVDAVKQFLIYSNNEKSGLVLPLLPCIMKLFSSAWGTGRAPWDVPWIFAWAVCLSGQNLIWEEYSHCFWENSVCKSLYYILGFVMSFCCVFSFICMQWDCFCILVILRGVWQYSSPYPVVFFYSVTVIVLYFLEPFHWWEIIFFSLQWIMCMKRQSMWIGF